MAETLYTAVTWTAGDVITEAKLDNMVANDRAVDAMSNGVQMAERADPDDGDVPANTLHVYVKDDGGYSEPYTKDENNVVDRLNVPAGSMLMWTTDTAPDGWLLCYGQAVSRATYAKLFAQISTTFGVGDGSTTFNLPDMRGRLPLGQDDMGGSSANRVTHAQADSIAGNEGAETHQLTIAEMPAHTHPIPVKDGDGANVGDGGANPEGTPNSNSTGGDGAHENMPPYLTLNYLIKF